MNHILPHSLKPAAEYNVKYMCPTRQWEGWNGCDQNNNNNNNNNNNKVYLNCNIN